MVYKGSVAFSAVAGRGPRGYRDGVRNLEVMLESLSGERRREIQEDGIVMEVKSFLFKCSRRSWREANWVRLSATS